MGGAVAFGSKAVARHQCANSRVSAYPCSYVNLTNSQSCGRIKESLRKKFASLANEFAQRLHAISSELAAIGGPPEVRKCIPTVLCLTTHRKDQQVQVEQLRTRLPAAGEALRVVALADAECNAANVEENDHTVFSYPDLEFELELVERSITKRLAFLTNQVCCACLHFLLEEPQHRLFPIDYGQECDKFDARTVRTVREHFPILRPRQYQHIE
jgi:hypothetical protein